MTTAVRDRGAAGEGQAEALPPDTGAMHVLLVEDNPVDAVLVEAMLSERAEPVRTSRARTLAEGLAALADPRASLTAPTCVMLDLGLPDSDGLDTVERVVAAAGPVPVVVLTGLADGLIGKAAVAAGAQDYLVKGKVDAELLNRVVDYSVERKRVTLALRALNQRLEERVAERTAELEDMTASMAHDLRAPLRAVSGYCEIILTDHPDELGDEATELLGRVVAAAGRMGRLIEGLLTLAGVGRSEFDPEPVDMGALVASVLDDLAGPERRPKVRIGPLPPAVGSPALLRQAWTHLLSNALKFSAGRDEAEITVFSWRGDGEAVYSVRDEGAGFDMAYADKLFGPFQRLHGEEVPGIGIGLAVVKRIVLRHGGRVWAESCPGGGSCFSFSIPDASPHRVG